MGRVLSNDNRYIVRWFKCETKDKLVNDYKSLYELIFEISNASNIKHSQRVDAINSKIFNTNWRLVFILDNVKEYSTIADILVNLPKDKVKIIITTRNALSIPDAIGSFETRSVELFGEDEIKNYLNKNLKKINDGFIQKVNELINFQKKNDQILPLELRLIVYNVNREFSGSLDKLIESVKKFSIYPRAPEQAEIERYKTIQECLFENLIENSKDAFRLLSICGYLDPDYINYTILNDILVQNPDFIGDDLMDSIENIEKYGLIENDSKTETCLFHIRDQAPI